MKVANRIARAAAEVARRGEELNHGLILANDMLGDWREVAKLERKDALSLKDRLEQLTKLDPNGHKAFRDTFQKERDQVNSAAKAANMNLRTYFDTNPGTEYVYVRVSDWFSLSKAVESGWTPNVTLPWGVLKTQATDRNRYMQVLERLPDDERKLMEQTDALVREGKMTEDAQTEKMAAMPGMLKRYNTTMKDLGYKGPDRAVKVTPIATGQGSSGPATKPDGTPAQAGTAAPSTPSSVGGGDPINPASATMLVGGATAQAHVVQFMGNLKAQPYAVIVGVAAALEGFMKSDEFAKIKAKYEEDAKKASERAPNTQSGRVLTPNQQKARDGVIGEEKATANAGAKGKSGSKKAKR